MRISPTMSTIQFTILLLAGLIQTTWAQWPVYTSRLVHRFSEEARARVVGGVGAWPARQSMEYYGMLLGNDVKRQEMRISGGGKYQMLVNAEGSGTVAAGNELGWLHYTWIDVGTPNVSFFVALDAGSDLLWIPCDCIQCAPLSASSYASLDRDLNEYSPANSTTSKPLTCTHALCELGSSCYSSGQPCPYMVQYYSENTSSSGLLVEDVLHLATSSTNVSSTPVQASIVIGCGMKQTGGYLQGVAPDGVMGLGLGDLSVPSFLAKAGVVRNSFSLCFTEDGSGTMFFGDHGLTTLQTTSFLPLNGKYSAYIVGVEACCIGKNSCLEQTNFEALLDSGSSFTFFPEAMYEKVVREFDKQVNATRVVYEGYPWKYCYNSSGLENLHLPSVAFVFRSNSSFVIHDAVFPAHSDKGVIVGYCLAIQPIEGDIAVIGQNFITGYRLVFDRENMRFGWSHSDCRDHSKEKIIPLPSPNGRPKSLPPNEQQSTSNGHAGAPSFPGEELPNSSNAASGFSPFWVLFLVQLFSSALAPGT
ncbi:hypothetical protein Droror1_Dr00027942 [Drosera rotundifolia]